MIAEIKSGDNGIFYVYGALDFSNVPKLAEDGYKIIDSNEKIIFDLANITSCDNSTLTLLTALTRRAKNSNKNISFVKLSKQLLDLVRVSNLIDIIPSLIEH